MSGYYKGMIKVVCEDMMCFRVWPETLEARSCSLYDPWALSDPDPEPVETISRTEWLRRLEALRVKKRTQVSTLQHSMTGRVDIYHEG